MGTDDSLPDYVATLKAMLRAERAARLAAGAEAQARTLLIEKLTLTIRNLRHEQFGQSSELRKTRTGRLWTYVRDDRPFAGPDPPAAAFLYSPDRGDEHPEQRLAGYAGLMQADAYAFSRLYEANRKGGPDR